MTAHSHVQRLHFMQQQQNAQVRHQAEINQKGNGGGGTMISGNDTSPRGRSLSAHPPPPPPHAQPRYTSTSTAYSGTGYAPFQQHPHRSGLYSAHSQGSLNSQPVSVSTFGPRSTAAGTRIYAQTNLKASRSLGASRASLASVKSGKSTIQQENRDRKVRQEVHMPWFGKAKVPFTIALILYILAFIFVLTGVVLTILTSNGRLFIPMDNSMAIGPIVLAIGVLFACVGIKFVYDAYKVNAMERGKLKFRAHNASMVSLNTIGSKRGDHDHHKSLKSRNSPWSRDPLMSGGATKNAVTRTPTGSRMSLSNI